MKILKTINILFIITWMIVIFLFSAADAEKSDQQSDEVIIKTAETIKQEKLTPKEKETLISKYIVLVRKSAHFFLYFVLAILVYVLIHDKYDTTLKTFLLTLIVCLLYAISDEIHQLFSNGRTARLFDVFIDCSGAVLAEMILTIFYYLKNKIRQRKLKKELS